MTTLTQKKQGRPLFLGTGIYSTVSRAKLVVHSREKGEGVANKLISQ